MLSVDGRTCMDSTSVSMAPGAPVSLTLAAILSKNEDVVVFDYIDEGKWTLVRPGLLNWYIPGDNIHTRKCSIQTQHGLVRGLYIGRSIGGNRSLGITELSGQLKLYSAMLTLYQPIYTGAQRCLYVT